MNTCEYNLGAILKVAEDLSGSGNPYPSLDRIQARTGLTTEQMVAALEFEPNPLGWRLGGEESITADHAPLVVRGKPYTQLIINRFVPQ